MTDIVVPELDGENNSVSFVVRKRQLEDFIESLVGSKRSDSINLEGVVRIRKVEVAQLCEKIAQFVERQYNAIITADSINVNYDGVHHRSFESFGVFIDSDELAYESAVELEISFSFLIHFPGSENPEKQDLIIMMYSEKYKYSKEAGISIKIHSNNVMWLSAIGRFVREEVSKFVIPVKEYFFEKVWFPYIAGAMALVAGLFLWELGALDKQDLESRALVTEKIVKLENLIAAGLPTHQAELIEEFGGKKLTSKTRGAIDDSERMDYLEYVMAKKNEIDQALGQLESLSSESSAKKQSKILEFLFDESKNHEFKIATAGLIGALSIILFGILYKGYIDRCNVSRIWLAARPIEPDRIRLSDFKKASALSLLISLLISSTFLIISLT